MSRAGIPRFLPLFTLCLSAWTGAWAAVTPGPIGSAVKIRVRIAEASARTEVRGFDLQIFGGGHRAPDLSPNRLSAWELHCQDGRIRVSAIGSPREVELKEPVYLESRAGFLDYKGRPYRDGLRVYSAGSLCEVINEVDLEKYLQGLVNSEFSSRWREEAIAAQVIAARTYALYQMNQRQPRFDLDSTERDQVYEGTVREDSRAARVVEHTRGVILTAGASPIKAFYHSTCGGQTEVPERVWGSHFTGFNRGVACPYCAKSPRFHWNAHVSASQIIPALLRGAHNDGSLPSWPADWRARLRNSSLTGIQVLTYDMSGRVLQVALSFFDTVQKRAFDLSVSGSRFRSWIGAVKLPSAIFRVTLARAGADPEWRLDGQGNGHGVGMCQWGAKVMGERGFTTASILKHYYPDAQLKKLW